MLLWVIPLQRLLDLVTTSRWLMRLQSLIWRGRLMVPLTIAACSVQFQSLADCEQSKEEVGKNGFRRELIV